MIDLKRNRLNCFGTSFSEGCPKFLREKCDYFTDCTVIREQEVEFDDCVVVLYELAEDDEE